MGHRDEIGRDRYCFRRAVSDLNVGLVNKVMDHIEAHPEQHGQRNWAKIVDELEYRRTGCGTAFCFAGLTIHLGGPERIRWVWDGIRSELFIDMDTAQIAPVQPSAQLLLGLTNYEAELFFHSYNTVSDLRAMVNALVKAENQRFARAAS